MYLNTWNLKKIRVDFFLPHMRWNTGGKLYIVTKWGEICTFFHLEFFPGGNFVNTEKWIYSKIPPGICLEKFRLEKIIQLEYTNHWVTHPATKHDLVA